MGGSMNKRAFALVLVTAVAGVAAGAARAADADPTMQQIYAAAQGGHLDQAQTMIAQVLRDHPKSGKAHYVAAELDARQGHLAAARSELEQAESYDPGLPFSKPAAVAELKSELQGGSRSAPVYAAPAYGRPAGGLPWVPILLVIGVIAVIWMFARRRSTPVVYAGGGMGGAPGPYGGGPGGYGGPGYGAPGMGGGGLGSNIAGGLAGGLAAGAGIVAGEELAHHFLDGGSHPQGTIVPSAEAEENPANADMGGNDFGVNDPGSWDDSGGDSGGGGGDDWT